MFATRPSLVVHGGQKNKEKFMTSNNNVYDFRATPEGQTSNRLKKKGKNWFHFFGKPVCVCTLLCSIIFYIFIIIIIIAGDVK